MRARATCVQIRGQHGRAPANGLLCLIAFVALLGGCTTLGPDYEVPDAPMSAQWLDIDAPRIGNESADYSQWWTVFGDPVLDSLVEQAYQQNLTLRIAGLRILEARATLGIARGSAFPQSQQINGGAAAVRLSDNESGSFIDPSFDTAETTFDLGWELDFWGRFRRAIESADAQLDASIAGFDDVMVTLAAEVARTYVLTRAFEKRLALTRGNVKTQQDALRIASVKVENGAVTELDLQQARAVLGNTQSTIPVLEAALRQSTNALAALLGLPPQSLSDLSAGTARIPVAPSDVSVGVPAELLRRRPDVRRAERLLAAQSAQIGVAIADLYPRFSLVGSVGFRTSDSNLGRSTGGSSLSSLFDSENSTSFLGPFFSWNVLNYGRIKNNIRVQDARFQQLLVEYQNTVLSALAETENAIVAYLKTHDQAALLEESVVAAQRSVDLSLLQYREGKVEFNRVIDALNFLFRQQDNLATATGDIATNLIAMYKSLGGGYQADVERDAADYVADDDKHQLRARTRHWHKVLSE